MDMFSSLKMFCYIPLSHPRPIAVPTGQNCEFVSLVVSSELVLMF